MIKFKKLIKKVIILVVAIVIMYLVYQLVIFAYFNEQPKLEISKISTDSDYENTNTKKAWKENCLNIEATTDIYVWTTYVRKI